MKPLHLDEDLPEEVRRTASAALRVWEPREHRVVLGRSNRPEQEVMVEACREDGVPILRRMGGGGAVLLTPGCLVVSLGVPVPAGALFGPYMARTVELLGNVASAASGLRLEPRGTGDLCSGDRKVLGSSAFHGRGAFFYQASLLVDLDLERMHRYLRHPSREPAYRNGRTHREFLTTLRTLGCPLSPSELGGLLEDGLRGRLREITQGA